MSDLVAGQRLGPFIVFRDEDGLRHAVRQGAIMTISETGETGESTFIQLTGQRSATVHRSFDQVLAWFL
jgi:hypothetical protein